MLLVMVVFMTRKDLMIMLGVRSCSSHKYKYLAMDSDGEWYAYVTKPVALKGSWGAGTDRLFICNNDGSNYSWELSLVELPLKEDSDIQHIGCNEEFTMIKTSANLYEKVLMEQIEEVDVKINTLIALKNDLKALLEKN